MTKRYTSEHVEEVVLTSPEMLAEAAKWNVHIPASRCCVDFGKTSPTEKAMR
jgi:hypothetical protein